MPRSGGTYTPPTNSWSPAVNGTLAVTADWNATLTDLSAALTQSVSKDGQTAMTGALDMGGNAITNSVTAAPGTSTTQVATTAFVAAAAFSSALPSQTGNEGKVVTTDGSNASWTDEITLSSLNSGQLAGFRNKIINGAMDISQRGTSFAAASGYTLDRWAYGFSGAGVSTVTQNADVPSSNEFQSSLRVAVTTADASIAAGDVYVLRQSIEGYNVRDLIGRTFTVSFWVRSSKTGIHCVALRNSISDRTYVAEYTVNVADTWEQKSFTVSGGLITAGTWNWTNGIGLNITWAMACGATFQTTANAWQVGNFQATASQVNAMDTIGNIFAITGVQVEVGASATPFEHRPYGAELALCQRYYYRETAVDANDAIGGNTNNTSTTTAFCTVRFPVTMRTVPSALEQTGTAANYVISASGGTVSCNAVPTYATASTSSIGSVNLAVAAGLTNGQCGVLIGQAGAYIGFTAEL